jgi:peptidoglycan/LPS O-acetylase OafA/YrhL
MNPTISFSPRASNAGTPSSRLDFLDATRAFALILGVVFHASMSFLPVFVGWAVQDISTSPIVSNFVTVSHSFRMEAFFLLAGCFSHGMYHRKGWAEFVRSRAIRIAVPFVFGWFLLHPLLVSGWLMGSASLRGDYSFWTGIKGGFEGLKTLPAGLFTRSHLWFLYYLLLITALTLLARALFVAVGGKQSNVVRAADAVVAWLAKSRASLLVLAVPTAAALWFMRFWGMDTPDQSLWPQLPVLAVYGGFFGLGWMFGRQPETISAFARLSFDRWLFGALGIAGTLWLVRFQTDPGYPNFFLAHIGFTASYAFMMWALVALTFGVFKTLCRRERPFVRYIADSSYWMYLVHLPIVVWLQVAVAEVPVHWSLKLAFVSLATMGAALLSYDLFVRSTVIGQVLNGRRRERALRFSRRGDAVSLAVKAA